MPTPIITKESKRENWTNTCANLNLQQGGREAWNLLHNLNGTKRKENPTPIHTESEVIVSDFRKTEIFNKAFASISKADRKTQHEHDLAKELKEKEKRETQDSTFMNPLTSTEMNQALGKFKKKRPQEQTKSTMKYANKFGE